MSLFFKDIFLLFLVMCLYVYMHTNTSAHGNQRSLEPLELESQATFILWKNSYVLLTTESHFSCPYPTSLSSSFYPSRCFLNEDPFISYSSIQLFSLSYYNLLAFPFSQNRIHFVWSCPYCALVVNNELRQNELNIRNYFIKSIF